MIISASRRTDIPAFFSKWFLRRIGEGFLCVRNPMNAHQVSRIDISPDVADAIVFWSKNPQPLLPHLEQLRQYTYYFQFTLNGYGWEIEKNIPSLNERIETFRTLSKLIGRERVIWRYDPIFLNERFSLSWHHECFSYIAEQLQGYTDRCVMSFVDLYPRIGKNIQGLDIAEPEAQLVYALADSFAKVAKARSLRLFTCAELIDLASYGIEHSHCIDAELISEFLGEKLNVQKDKMQRAVCGCVSSIDVGAYNTCRHGCAYCYANHSLTTVQKNKELHDPDSPLLIGNIGEGDIVTERKVKSLINKQGELF